MGKSRKDAICRALMAKGFGKRSANNIAKATMRKSRAYVTDWKQSLRADFEASKEATRQSEQRNRQAAINKLSTMAGKVVVIPPKRP